MHPHISERAVASMAEAGTLNETSEDRRNLNEISQSNMFNVLLLILTGCSFAIFAVLFARYITPIYQSSLLKERVRALELEKSDLSMKLTQCQLKSVGRAKLNDILDKQHKSSHTPRSEAEMLTVNTGERKVMTDAGSNKKIEYENMDFFSDPIRDYCADIRSKTKPKKITSKNRQPETIGSSFQLHAQISGPNQLNGEMREHESYDDYDFDAGFIASETSIGTKGKSRFDEADNIRNSLLEIEVDVSKMMESCKQMKNEDGFDSDILRKVQRKLMKLKKKIKRNVETINKSTYSDVASDERNGKRYKQRNNEQKRIKNVHVKAQNRTMKNHKKTALKTYEERRL